MESQEDRKRKYAHFLGKKHTPETIEKLKAIARTRPRRKHSPETRAKIGAAHVGMKRSAETRAKQSAAKKGKPVSEKLQRHLEELQRFHRGKKRPVGVGARITAAKIAKWATVDPEQRREHMLPAVRASHVTRPTSIEVAVRGLLTELAIPFEVEHRIGRYLVDVFIPALALVIECDGEYWHRNRQDHDSKRDAYLRAKGFRILRLPERQIRNGSFRTVVLEVVS